MIAATGSCSHIKSYHYFARSILFKNDFVAVKCSSWEDYQENKCNDTDNTSTFMGEHVDAMFVFFAMKFFFFCLIQLLCFRQYGDYFLVPKGDNL